jgi:hypothetical protein
MQREIKQLLEWLERNPGGAGKARDVLKALATKVLTRFEPYHTDEDRQIPADEVAKAAGWTERNGPTKWMSFDKTAAMFWQQRARAIALAANEAGLDSIAKPVYRAGGGAKNPSLLTFELVRVDELLSAVKEDDPIAWRTERVEDRQTDAAAPRGVVYYEMIAPEKMQLGWRARCLFRRGVVVKGSWAWRILTLLLISPIILGLVYWALLSTASIGARRPVEVRDVWMLITLGTLAVLAWYFVFRPWHELLDDRIIPADDWLSLKEPSGQLEIHKVGSRRELRFVRYTAPCPVCAATLHLEKGGVDFPGRLVGRCADSPREHVFSFDRVTLTGMVLRAPPNWQRDSD